MSLSYPWFRLYLLNVLVFGAAFDDNVVLDFLDVFLLFLWGALIFLVFAAFPCCGAADWFMPAKVSLAP